MRVGVDRSLVRCFLEAGGSGIGWTDKQDASRRGSTEEVAQKRGNRAGLSERRGTAVDNKREKLLAKGCYPCCLMADW